MPVLEDGTVVTVRQPTRPPLVVAQPDPTTRSIVVVRGQRGLPGIPGASDGVEIVQVAPSSSWVISVPVDFGRRPVVAVYISGELVEADVTADSTTVSVQFPTPASGSVVLT